ncbi:MAG: DNA polymerase IV [candidate division KSB1 bacterium]|nr:DNA polymerase IV [candidate division KSB1 bacterium]MDZ7345997.1 DNA polymerase IV [candidate division KSB1 bacterium]
MRETMSRWILHLDMDAFFAAVEQLDFPELRGKPVVVGADPKGGKGRGVVSTCSYEARAFGIRSAMPISEAYRRCPQAVFVRPRGKRYGEISRQIMQILGEFSPLVEPISIDEAFVDITSTLKFFGSPEETARRIKARVRQETGLTASVGLAPNKFIAKIASDLRKPDGLVIVREEEVQSFLAPLPISRLWGVGAKTLPRLEALGIRTIGDLAAFPRHELYKIFGEAGLHYHRLAQGIDERPVGGEASAKSIGREITFEQDVNDEEKLTATLRFLCNELAHEMRRYGLAGSTVTLKIRLHDFSTFTRSHTLAEPVDHFAEIFATAVDLFRRFERHGTPVRLLGVAVSRLTSCERQLTLFGAQESPSHKADEVMDRIRARFGKDAITRAASLGAGRDSEWIREE